MIIIVQRIFGWYGMVMFLLIAFMAVSNLEAVNYLEHYGLVRKEISPGVYEKVNITHSWNAPQRLTNYLLFKVQRHSDHHENAYKPYQTLLTLEESPMLVSGYYLGIVMVFKPEVWFEIMNPITIAYNTKVKLTEEQKKNEYTICREGYVEEF